MTSLPDLNEKFESLFRSLHGDPPDWNWASHWTDLYEDILFAGVRRPVLKPEHELYLRAMEFDEVEPIFDPLARKWKEDVFPIISEGWNRSMVNTLRATRAFIRGYRILRGLVEGEVGSRARCLVTADNDSRYDLYADQRCTFALVDHNEYRSSRYYNKFMVPIFAATDDDNRVIVAATNLIQDVVDIVKSLEAVTRDKRSPEYQYSYRIYLTRPYPVFESDVKKLLRLDKIIQLNIVCVGAGPVYNAKINKKFEVRQGVSESKAFWRVKNDIGLLPGALASQEAERYQAYERRKRLLALAKERPVSPCEPRIF